MPECTPTTTTVYTTKTLNQLPESIQSKMTTETFNTTPTAQCRDICRTETVLVQSTVVKTKPVLPANASTCSHTIISVDGTCMQQNKCEGTCTPNQSLPVLGALLGIAIVALTVTTTGWIWTCWRMKRRGESKINSDKQER